MTKNDKSALIALAVTFEKEAKAISKIANKDPALASFSHGVAHSRRACAGLLRWTLKHMKQDETLALKNLLKYAEDISYELDPSACEEDGLGKKWEKAMERAREVLK